MEKTENKSFPYRTCCPPVAYYVCSCNKSDPCGDFTRAQRLRMRRCCKFETRTSKLGCFNRPSNLLFQCFPGAFVGVLGEFNMQQHLIFEHFLDVEKLLRCLRSDSLCFKCCKSIACCVLTLLEFPWHVISRVISKMGSEYKEIQEVKLCLIYFLYSFIKCIERWSA